MFASRAAAQLPTPTYGWNLGNTLEPPTGEGSWGPAATQALIDAVAAAGFNTVRIPCAWDSHANQTTHEIDAGYLARVKQVVDWCRARNLYVIVNCHWDNGWLENNIGATVNPAIDAKMNAYWTQIATAFRDYDAHLLFAGTNEPGVSTAAQMATLLAYHQTFVNAVRATGGSNTTRWLVVQGPGTDIDKTDTLMNTLPSDPTPGRLAVEVHYYSPYQFTLMTQDESWGKMFYFWGAGHHHPTRTDRNANWGEEAFVDAEFQKMQAKFVARGIPVIVGEFQATKRSATADLSGTDLELHRSSRTYFHQYVVTSANSHGLKPIYWDIAGQLFNWTTGALVDADNQRALTGPGTPVYSGPKQAFFRTGEISFTPAFNGTVLQYAATGLPGGLTIDAATGKIGGTVTHATTATATITATGTSGTASQQIALAIAPDTLTETRLANLSLRSNTAPGDKIATVGLVLTGDKVLLGRLAGPALVPYGVSGTLAQPVLKLYRGQTLLATYGAQKDSSDPAGVAQASSYAGAFSFDATAADAGIVLPLTAGQYTLQAIGQNDASGVGLIELYDLDRGAGRFANLSTRAEVGIGTAVMIDGFVVDGPGQRTFLIRAVGPALAAYGVSGTLADPRLTVYRQDTGQPLASNDNWDEGQDGATIAAAAKKVAAFELAPGSRDAAVLVSLPAGAYSVTVEGVNGTTGVALAELYDLTD
jgi:aryl-phospho-beta-D-glucosidase BglC (GH1 family)